ncbi:MAG: hypothetical protein LBS18_06805, partial [Clostridiales bacterium]|nr:hypothetical protein [Clostridiales bacterium]
MPNQNKWLLAVVLLLIVSFAYPSLAQNDENLLYNADFSIRAEQQALPAGWYFDAWVADNTHYELQWDEEGARVIYLRNLYENDARVCQRVSVAPDSFYRFSCDMKARDITAQSGANLSVLDTFSGTKPIV